MHSSALDTATKKPDAPRYNKIQNLQLLEVSYDRRTAPIAAICGYT